MAHALPGRLCISAGGRGRLRRILNRVLFPVTARLGGTRLRSLADTLCAGLCVCQLRRTWGRRRGSVRLGLWRRRRACLRTGGSTLVWRTRRVFGTWTRPGLLRRRAAPRAGGGGAGLLVPSRLQTSAYVAASWGADPSTWCWRQSGAAGGESVRRCEEEPAAAVLGGVCTGGRAAAGSDTLSTPPAGVDVCVSGGGRGTEVLMIRR